MRARIGLVTAISLGTVLILVVGAFAPPDSGFGKASSRFQLAGWFSDLTSAIHSFCLKNSGGANATMNLTGSNSLVLSSLNASTAGGCPASPARGGVVIQIFHGATRKYFWFAVLDNTTQA